MASTLEKQPRSQNFPENSPKGGFKHMGKSSSNEDVRNNYPPLNPQKRQNNIETKAIELEDALRNLGVGDIIVSESGTTGEVQKIKLDDKDPNTRIYTFKVKRHEGKEFERDYSSNDLIENKKGIIYVQKSPEKSSDKSSENINNEIVNDPTLNNPEPQNNNPEDNVETIDPEILRNLKIGDIIVSRGGTTREVQNISLYDNNPENPIYQFWTIKRDPKTSEITLEKSEIYSFEKLIRNNIKAISHVEKKQSEDNTENSESINEYKKPGFFKRMWDLLD